MDNTRTKHRSHRWLPATAAVLAFTLIATGCPDDDDGGTDTPQDAGGSPTGGSSPSDTATSAPSTGAATTSATTGSTPSGGTTEGTVGTGLEPEAAVELGDAHATCAYRDGELIALESDADSIDAIELDLGRLSDTELTADLHLYRVDTDPLQLAADLAAGGIDASPNYINAFAPGWKYAPEDTPVGRANWAQPPISPAEAEGTIAVVDTGFDARALAALGEPPSQAPVLWTRAGGIPGQHATSSDVEVRDGIAAGHGTFIVGILAQLLRDARITAVGVDLRYLSDDDYAAPTDPALPHPASVRDDSTVTAVLADLLDREPDLSHLNLSFGTYGCSGQRDRFAAAGEPVPPFLTPLGLRTVLSNMGGQIQVFAASGNDGHRASDPEVFYPAGWHTDYPTWLHSVASDGLDGVDYSNRGPWVELQARGSRTVSVLPTTSSWTDVGWAAWSGTSFATPCALAASIRGDDLVGASPEELTGDESFIECGINAEP